MNYSEGTWKIKKVKEAVEICKEQIVLQKNLIFLCSRKADLELIYKTSLWELFWFDLTWQSYMPAKEIQHGLNN